MSQNTSEDPLTVEELMACLRKKWGVCYEMRILIRDRNVFLHIMWGFLEQQSFPIGEVEFKQKLSEVIDFLNRTGKASITRNWLLLVKGKPKLGKALSLRLNVDDRFKEFLL